MIGRKSDLIPNNEPPQEDVANEAQPNTGQGAQPDQSAVGAGPGNQPLDNETPSSHKQSNEPKPGAQPDGNLSGVPGAPRNEGVE